MCSNASNVYHHPSGKPTIKMKDVSARKANKESSLFDSDSCSAQKQITLVSKRTYTSNDREIETRPAKQQTTTTAAAAAAAEAAEEPFSGYAEEVRPTLDAPPRQSQEVLLPPMGNVSGGGRIPLAAARYLFDYQVEGVAWMWSKFCNSQGGILGWDSLTYLHILHSIAINIVL